MSEQTIGSHLLGRHKVPDDRIDLLHAPSTLMALHPTMLTLPSQLPHKKDWTVDSNGKVLVETVNQGQTPKCTAYASFNHVQCPPHPHPDLYPGFDAFYNEEKQDDGLPAGSDGSTTQAAVLVLQRHGLVNPPLWVHDEWTLRKWILLNGPVQVGTDWYRNMFTPNAQGVVSIGVRDSSNPVDGGHEYLVVGYDFFGFGKAPVTPGKGAPLYKLQNSWGPGWGDGGFFYMNREDLGFLITSDGDGFATENWDGLTPEPAAP